MKLSLKHLMAQASRLTRGGDLRAATAAIQSALAGASAAAPVEERVRPAMQAVDADVIDAVVIERPPGPSPAPIAQPIAERPLPTPAPGGTFASGRYTGAAGSREYKLYAPPGGHTPGLPLVVMLHGCTQNPDDFAAGTRMNDAVQEGGFFVLYPAQAQSANTSGCWNWFKHNHQGRDRGEPALLAGLTREIIERHAIDPKRVYVAGLSAGGAMAAILGDAFPELFAAVGVHSGLRTGAATDVPSAFAAMRSGAQPGVPAREAKSRPAPPTIVFHGDADTTVHPRNGEQVVAACAADATPSAEPVNGDNGREVTRHVYRDSGARVVAEHWVVHGAGHAWSGGSAEGSYTDAAGPDATAEMLRFFRATAR